MTKSQKQAKEFMNLVAEYGWELSDVKGSVVEIVKWITPNDNDSFVKADMEYYSILSALPGSGGSIWGTDGGGIGALSAMNTGRMSMKKSGVSKHVANALKRML